MKKVLGIVGLIFITATGFAQTITELKDCNEEDFLNNKSTTYTPPKYVLPNSNMWKKWSRNRNNRHTFGFQKSSTSLGATIITAEDIALAPARNLLDLLEVYVPGAYWLNAESGKVIGMQGWIASRNLRYQVLVDGVNVNQQTHSGAMNELENWDLDDIAQIEVIRGAAAARYGTGAVAGVILISTKAANGSKKQTNINGAFMSSYNSMGGNFSHRVSNDDLDFSFFGSWRKTAGYSPKAFSNNLNGEHIEFGYLGQDFRVAPFDKTPLAFYNDYNNAPQLKLAAHLRFRKKWNLRLRYTSAGGTVGGTATQTLQQTGMVIDSVTTDVNGFPVYAYSREYANELVNLKAFQTRQFTVSLGRQWNYIDSSSNKGYIINSQVSWNTQDYENRRDTMFTFNTTVPENTRKRLSDIDDPIYKKHNFSETTLNLRLSGTYAFPIGQITLGTEYTHRTIGIGWGDFANELRVGEEGAFVNSNKSKVIGFSAQQGGFTPSTFSEGFIGNGWYSYQTEAFSELSLSPAKWVNFTAMSRLTNHAYSKTAWNHRFALSFPINHQHSLQLSRQIAHRLGTEEQLYATYSYDNLASPERFDGVSFNYQFTPTYHWRFAVQAYQNQVELSNLHTRQNLQYFRPIGKTTYRGIELEANYTSKSFNIGANYSKVMPIEAPTYFPGNYADSLHVQTTFFNNNPNQIAKLWIRYKFFNNRATVQANFRAMWDYAYAQKDLNERVYPAFDELETVAESPQELEEIRALKQVFLQQNPYNMDARLDISASLKISDNIVISAYVLNLWSNNKGRRYTYDDGLQAHEADPQLAQFGVAVDKVVSFIYSPQRLKFIEEPLVFGLKLNLTL
ncbi:TonB-dependent receptor plug domain-containing protein [Microscilla marina]|uniref:TonB-dependent receptor plug domain protein n=1 Tax=Microscilla marina ATCC 23134 TaxID=313606 RepID=A1ZWH8_MICM2|nr:TonB-dependent receptor plug domain-containing protein [Microscilla marina]EAY25218.1 TonB-dependent receptor plug domain protein [Microscilla marina ATCC 23134]